MRLDALRQALGNPSILRAQLGWLIATAAQWAYLVAALVFAYDLGGVAATGLASTLRMLPAAVLAPFVTSLADALPPTRVLVGVHVGRGLAVGLGAVAILTGLPPVLLFVAILVEGLIATLHRPTTMALMPALARSPRELVATNAATSSGEAIGTLVGPAVGGLAIALVGPGSTVAAAALAFAAAALVVAGLDARRPLERPVGGSAIARLRELLAGFGALWEYPSVGHVVALFSAQTFVRGMLTVLLVATSLELLRLGESGVGYLSAAIGAGGLLGAVVALGLVGRRHLAAPISIGLAAWGLPIAVIGLVPAPAIAFVALAALGVANAVLDVAGFSLMQRCTPNRVRGRVFGAFESIVTLTFGLGSLVAPIVVAAVGVQYALVVTGLILPVLALVSAPLVRRADAAAVVPHHQLELLRGVPMFSPLAMTSLEQIAGELVEEQHDPEVTVIRQGDAGDCWYLVATGAVDVARNDRGIARLGPGDGFGEIALLSEQPRTATVTTAEPTVLYRLPRAAFLEAVTGHPHALQAGEELVRSRLERTAR